MFTNIIELREINKTFPGNKIANQDCSLFVRQGEVHAIVGENGAGKTTLMNILYGLHQPDNGKIIVHGKERVIENPRFAKSLGIQMVHQHFMLVPSFTVLQNIILGFEPRKSVFIDVKEAIQRVEAICDRYRLSIPLHDKVENLAVGIRQRVEIVKAIYRQANILILDEPTAVLTPQEVDELFQLCNEMINDNKTILFISHKLKEVIRISNRITVMRKGRTIETVNKESTSDKDLATLIIGKERNAIFAEHILKEDIHQIGYTIQEETLPVILKLDNISVKNSQGHKIVKNISLELHAGEIVGIAGVEGNGQSEMVEAIAGMLPLEDGDIIFDGISLKNCTIQNRRSKGLRHIPEDRMHTGLCLDANICENFIVDQTDRNEFLKFNSFINWDKVRMHAKRLIKKYNISANHEDVKLKTLSGGNMQKVVVARELTSMHKCLLISHPTRGVDIGAADFIYKQIMDAKNNGVAILLVSADLDELFLLSDRLTVLYEGEITGEFHSGSISTQKIGLYMTGVQKQRQS